MSRPRERMSIGITPADRALIESAAKAAGVSVSAWVVHAARKEARWAVARRITSELAAEVGVTDADRAWAASAVLAQFWRDGLRQTIFARMLRNPGLVEAPLHHADAKRIGELLRDSGTSDVVDAHVAVLAERLSVPVITSDPDDISRLNPAIDLIHI